MGLARRRRVVDGGVGDVAVPVYHRVEQRMRGSIGVGGIPLRKVSGGERRGAGSGNNITDNEVEKCLRILQGDSDLLPQLCELIVFSYID